VVYFIRRRRVAHPCLKDWIKKYENVLPLILFIQIVPIAAYIRIRPNPGQLPRIAELAQQIPEVVECHRVTGEDCFILKVHIPAIDQLDRLLDSFLLYGSTTTSIIQSSPVPLRPPPLPEEATPD